MISIATRAGRCTMLAAVSIWLGGTHSSFAQTTDKAAAAPAATAGDILKKLRKGGYVVYVRHTQTDSNTKDGDLSNVSDRSKQRILSKEGQDNAVKLGEL